MPNNLPFQYPPRKNFWRFACQIRELSPNNTVAGTGSKVVKLFKVFLVI